MTFRFVVAVDTSDVRPDAEERLALILASALHLQFGADRARLYRFEAGTRYPETTWERVGVPDARAGMRNPICVPIYGEDPDDHSTHEHIEGAPT